MEERFSKTFFDTYRMSSCKKLFYSTKILAFVHIIKLIRLDFKTTINNAINNIIGESLAKGIKRKCDKGGILFGTKPG